MSTVKEPKYFDKLMLPSDGAVYIYNDDMRSPFHSFLHAINSTPTIGGAMQRPNFNTVRIINERLDPIAALSDDDFDIKKDNRLTLTEAKDELCKLAVERIVYLSKDNSEIYGERFSVYGELNYTHDYMFDYGLLYGNFITNFSAGEKLYSKFYENMSFPTPDGRLVPFTDRPFELDAYMVDSPIAVYNHNVHKDIYCVCAGKILIIKGRDKFGVEKEFGLPDSYFGPRASLFVPVSTLTKTQTVSYKILLS